VFVFFFMIMQRCAVAPKAGWQAYAPTAEVLSLCRRVTVYNSRGDDQVRQSVIGAGGRRILHQSPS
jgi:hypothetical protein